jgi:cytidine deaminase
VEWGQNLRGTFPFADVFINVANRDTVKNDVSRFIELIFNNTDELHTPTRDEYGMFLARARRREA